MKELLSTLLETSRERLKNPFVGAFIISFAAINWRPIWIILFSDRELEERIWFVEQFYMTTEYGVLYPLGVALFYVIVLPYVTWGLDRLVSKSTSGRKQISIEHQVEDIKGKQSLAEEEAKLEDIKANYRDKADLNKRIERLQSQLDERENQLREKAKELQRLERRQKIESILSDEEHDDADFETQLQPEYEDFKKSDMYNYFEETGVSIRNQNQFPHGLNDIIKEKFLINDIIKEVSDNENQRTYYLFTDKGNFFWKKYVLSVKVEKKSKTASDFDPDDLPF